jgi:hypothetical protein
MFPVSLFPMLRFHFQHLFTLLFTLISYISSLVHSLINCVHTTLILTKLLPSCDIAARTVLLYVLLCLTYMYCTLYILYILHTVHIVHVSLFPSFPCLSDVEASSSTYVRAYWNLQKNLCWTFTANKLFIVHLSECHNINIRLHRVHKKDPSIR